MPRSLTAITFVLMTLPTRTPAAPTDDVLCEYFSSAVARSMEERAFDPPAQGLERQAQLLDRRRLKAEKEMLEAACPDGLATVVQRQRMLASMRAARQADCHYDGKQLALLEDSGANEPVREHLRLRVDECIANGVAAAEVTFASTDGGIVAADVYGTGDHAVILAHGGRFTKESWQAQAAEIAEAGFYVVAIDFRGRGRSRGPESAPGSRHHNDILGAISYLRDSQLAKSISIVGASFGGGAAAQASAASAPGEISHLVLLAHSTIDTPEAMTGCKLFVVAKDDIRGGGVPRLDEIRAQFEAAPEPKELVVLPGEAHAQFLFDKNQSESLMETILQFLKSRCET